MKKSTKVTIIIAIIVLLIAIPLIINPGSEFEGSDGQGSEMVDEITGGEYEPWTEPILERLLGGEIPGEMETLFFCIQTGIGVAIIAYGFGYLAAKKKHTAQNP